MAITVPTHPNARYYTDPTGASFLAIITEEHRDKKGRLNMVSIAYYDNRGGGGHRGPRSTKRVCVYAKEVRHTGQNMTLPEWASANGL